MVSTLSLKQQNAWTQKIPILRQDVKIFNDMYHLLLQVIWLRDHEALCMRYKTYDTESKTYPHVLFRDECWYDWMYPVYHDTVEYNKKYLIPKINIKEQINTVLNKSAIIIRPWTGETTLIIGCGHITEHTQYKNDHRHKGEYTFDISPNTNSDCIIEVGHASIAEVLPEDAICHIEKIVMEGVCIEETPCLIRDLFILLIEGGIVYCDKLPVLKKMDGNIIHIYIPNSYRHGCQEMWEEIAEYYEYIPWSLELSNENIYLLSLGSDAFLWEYMY
jgi:hypothetical protein